MSAPVREGEILAGKYRVDRVLGVGGMGVVVAAHHIELDEPFAIKFLLPEMLKNEDAVARFAREARAAAKIKNEHVARVSDVGTLENGAPYMVMEYLEGVDLAGLIAQRGRVPTEQAVDMVLQASEAIGEAHSLGIIHRDLKPANLFLANRPNGRLCVKVLDFGISKSSLGGAMTRTSALMGSPLYMSPEQMQSSKDVDPRSDIWALGVILYELLTGEAPFVAETMPELVLRIMREPPPPLRQALPDAPAALEAVLLKCLDKERSRRFSSVAELAAALAPFASKGAPRPMDARALAAASAPHSETMSAGPGATASAGGGTMASWGRTFATKGRTPVLVVGGVVVVLCAGLAAILLHKPGSTETTVMSASSPSSSHPALATEPAPPSPATTAAVSAARAESSPLPAAQASAAPPPEVASAPAAAGPPHPSEGRSKTAAVRSKGSAKGQPAAPTATPAPAPAPTKEPAHRPASQSNDEWGGGRL